MFAPDDAIYIFALGANGPEGRAVKHGNPAETTLDQTGLIRKLVHDETKQTTIYDLTIPFKNFPRPSAKATRPPWPSASRIRIRTNRI